MTHFRTDAARGFRYTTDAVAGHYEGRATKHQGLNMSGNIRLTTWFEAQVVFVREADGVEEFAWRSERAYATEKQAAPLARMEAGRRAKALKRGVRLEWAWDIEQAAKRMAKREKNARFQAAKASGPALLEALKGLMIDCPFGPATPEAAGMNWNQEMREKHAHWVAARAAIAAAEDWEKHARRD